jgi:hypothetical protein
MKHRWLRCGTEGNDYRQRNKEGPMMSYDVSVPLPHFYEVVEVVMKRVGDLTRVVGCWLWEYLGL